MFVTDASKAILRVNRAFSEITGYSAEEIAGQTPRALSSGRHGEAFYAEMAECLQWTGVWHGEIWERRKNGEEYPAWLTITAVKDEHGNSFSAMVYYREGEKPGKPGMDYRNVVKQGAIDCQLLETYAQQL